MEETKVTKKPATEKTATVKKTTAKKPVAAKKVTGDVKTVINAENVGFKAGDVYQALATAGKALSVQEIAKAAKITEKETLLGMGWLLKEGKIKDENDLVTLA